MLNTNKIAHIKLTDTDTAIERTIWADDNGNEFVKIYGGYLPFIEIEAGAVECHVIY